MLLYEYEYDNSHKSNKWHYGEFYHMLNIV